MTFNYNGINFFVLVNNIVGTGDYSNSAPNAVSSSFVGEAVILSHVTINNIYCIVTMIGKTAFYYCSKLTNIVIPNTINTLKYMCFRNLNLDTLIIPSSVKIVESWFINNWGPKILVFCGTKDPKMIDTESGNDGHISSSFSGNVLVPNDYEASTFCLRSIEKKTLTECSIIQTFISMKLHRARTCFRQRQQIYFISLFIMIILLIS